VQFGQHPEFLEDYLPWNPEVQELCGKIEIDFTSVSIFFLYRVVIVEFALARPSARIYKATLTEGRPSGEQATEIRV
jgi:hypothetical protein